MAVTLSPVMTANEIIQYINENPGLSLNGLRDLASRVDVSDAVDDRVSILYTGPVDGDSANAIATDLANQHDGYIGIIDDTNAKLLFDDPIFTLALQQAVDTHNIDNPDNTTTLGNELFKTDNGMWSIASENLASKASGDVVVILSPDADDARVFGKNELPKLLANPDVDSINGIPKGDLKLIFDSLGGTDDARLAVMEAVKLSGGEMLMKLESFTNDLGEKIYKTDTFFEHVHGVAGTDFPEGASNITKYSDMFAEGGLYGSWHDSMDYVAHSPLLSGMFHNLQKAGIVGSFIGLGIASIQAQEAYATGDVDGAVQIMTDYFIDMAIEEGIGLAAGLSASAIFSSSASALLAAAGITASIPVIMVGGVAMIASIAGSIYADEIIQYAKDLYNVIETEIDEALAYLELQFDEFVDAFVTDITTVIDPVLLEVANLMESLGDIRFYDPLVLDMDGDGIELVSVANSDVQFDFDKDGFNEKAGWVAPDDAFLVWDKNDNGQIDDIDEMFGNETISGFDELRPHAGYDQVLAPSRSVNVVERVGQPSTTRSVNAVERVGQTNTVYASPANDNYTCHKLAA